VLLNSRAREAVVRQRPLTQLAADFVFTDPRFDSPGIDERAFRRSYWTPTLSSLGLRYRRPYNTRHSDATMMLMAGMTPAFCAKQLGHSVGMLLGTYGKWLDGAHSALETNSLEAALRRDLSQDLTQIAGHRRGDSGPSLRGSHSLKLSSLSTPAIYPKV
jgi:integrase